MVRSMAVGGTVFVTAGYMIYGLSDLLKIAAVFAVCVAVAVLLQKYRNSAPIAYAADWAKRQSLRWRKLEPQGNVPESNGPSDAAEVLQPTSQNSTEEAADDNSHIDSH